MDTEIIEEHRADGSVCVTSKEYRDYLTKLAAQLGGEDELARMIKCSFQQFPIREPFVIEKNER